MLFKEVRIKLWLFSKAQNTALKYKQHIMLNPIAHEFGGDLVNVIDEEGYVRLQVKEIEHTVKASHLEVLTDNGSFYYWCPITSIHEDDYPKIETSNLKTVDDDKFKKERKKV